MSLKTVRAEILTIILLLFRKINVFINSFWVLVTFRVLRPLDGKLIYPTTDDWGYKSKIFHCHFQYPLKLNQITVQWAPSSSSVVSDLIYSTVGDSPIVQRNRLRPATKENVMNFYEKKKPKVQSWRQHQNISVEFSVELQAFWDHWIFSIKLE